MGGTTLCWLGNTSIVGSLLCSMDQVVLVMLCMLLLFA
jgi:hypothetical protein